MQVERGLTIITLSSFVDQKDHLPQTDIPLKVGRRQAKNHLPPSTPDGLIWFVKAQGEKNHKPAVPLLSCHYPDQCLTWLVPFEKNYSLIFLVTHLVLALTAVLFTARL